MAVCSSACQSTTLLVSLRSVASDLGALHARRLMDRGIGERRTKSIALWTNISKNVARANPASHRRNSLAASWAVCSQNQTPRSNHGCLQAAARVAGDHRAGAPIRRTFDLYNELVQDEIHLHFASDGSDRIGDGTVRRRLTLQTHRVVDRVSSGGFFLVT